MYVVSFSLNVAGLSPDEIEYKKRQLLFKLQQLNSPVLASVDASAHDEFILVCLQPSDIRIQLLEWLFFKYDPTLVQAVKVPPHSTEDLRTLSTNFLFSTILIT